MTDANVVLGYLPTELAGGEITLDAQAARAAVKTIADAMELGSVEAAAAGIVDIVNENMFGALRLVSVQQGFDPRDFALVAFGGAGPLHANALGKLTGAWPVIIPPSPGVLCAYGDATFDAEHSRLFSFLLQGNEHELVSARATVTGPRPNVGTVELPDGGTDPSAALARTTRIWVDGDHADAAVYDRTALLAGNVVAGPAIITEMDSTTLVLPGHAATVHPGGSLLIRPTEG